MHSESPSAPGAHAAPTHERHVPSPFPKVPAGHGVHVPPGARKAPGPQVSAHSLCAAFGTVPGAQAWQALAPPVSATVPGGQRAQRPEFAPAEKAPGGHVSHTVFRYEVHGTSSRCPAPHTAHGAHRVSRTP